MGLGGLFVVVLIGFGAMGCGPGTDDGADEMISASADTSAEADQPVSLRHDRPRSVPGGRDPDLRDQVLERVGLVDRPSHSAFVMSPTPWT